MLLRIYLLTGHKRTRTDNVRGKPKFFVIAYNVYREIFRMKKWESVRELQSLCGRYDLKTIFETRRHNFMCQLYDLSNSLVRVCYVVHMLH